ncbi:hypothetical protein DFJ74DRAFT_691906 [Hyaloraphidium curvatum]|nr:hypothetical protein DFJ74DRAFT_691906 [Hyaloraphidium curvatum]
MPVGPPMKAFSAEVPGAPDIPGESKPRRHPLFLDALRGPTAEFQTAVDCFEKGGLKKNPNGNCFGVRNRNADGSVAPGYSWQNYTTVWKRFHDFGSGLIKEFGVQPGAMIGMMSVNRPEWVITEYATYLYGLTNVPIYDTLGSQGVAFIMEQTGMSLVVATSDKAKALIKDAKDLKLLKTLIIMDGENIKDDLKAAAEAAGIGIHKFSDIEASGAKNPAPENRPKVTDIATICYTSGTTGNPKGAVLSHGNFVTVVQGVLLALMEKGRFVDLGPGDVFQSYLPLAHVFERTVELAMYTIGGSVGFYQGDATKLMDDLVNLKPTIFASVPRLYNRIYDGVLSAVNKKGGIAKQLFEYAYKSKISYLQKGQGHTHSLWDRVVFGKIKEKLGGRVKIMITGAAPLSQDVINFFRVVFCTIMVEGYGQTENFCGISIGDCADIAVGMAIDPCSEIKLVDLPELNYRSTDKPYPRGEICVRGPAVFQGYYKDEEKTAETIDKDGWQHTGDVGQFGDGGRLQIIDRVKNIFKLAQGEYVAPEKIEIALSKHPIVQQLFVHGDSLQTTLVGVLVAEPSELKAFLEKKGLAGKDAKDPAVRKAVVGELESFGKQNGLKGFECLKNLYLESEPFSVENNLLTPTFKLKRQIAAKHYRPQIDAMYAESL